MLKLEDANKLYDSLSFSQLKDLKETLGDDLFEALDSAFTAESESDLQERASAFVELAKKNKMKILKARRIFDNEQKKLIMKFMED